MNNMIQGPTSTLEKCLLLKTCCTSIKDKAYLLGTTALYQDVFILKFVKFLDNYFDKMQSKPINKFC